ncbi:MULTISPECIES: hypothetical protein [unclassified Streptomyces]|uniref:hypothetical protein n=1 Tax=unclassified Streptomyces TaxID=2593676 RepID=UPI0021566A93|nr:hypothetical protein [Streptomyces sp. SM10]
MSDSEGFQDGEADLGDPPGREPALLPDLVGQHRHFWHGAPSPFLAPLVAAGR